MSQAPPAPAQVLNFVPNPALRRGKSEVLEEFPQVHYSLHIPQRERETHHSPLHRCPGLCVFSCGLGREALSKALSLVGGRGKFVCSSAWRVSQSKAKGSFFSLQISLWRGKVHLCNTSLPAYNTHQDRYVSSLLCGPAHTLCSHTMLWVAHTDPVVHIGSLACF